jgi:hypothetical protein
MEEDQEEIEDEPEMQYEQREYEHREDPNHPYCTNWPITKKRDK